jgi:hypothetical protein
VRHVYDYKTGFENIPRAFESLQLAAQVLSVALAHGVDRVIGHIVSVRANGTLWFDTTEFGVAELNRTETRIRAIVDRVAQARAWITGGDYPAVSPGSHCKYCPAITNCPAYKSTSADIVSGHVPTALTAESAIATWNWIERSAALIKRAEGLRDMAKKSLRQYLDASGAMTLGDGRSLALYPEARESIDGIAAMPVLREKFGVKVDGIVKVSVSKSDIYEALKEDDPSRGIGKRNEALLASLRDVGAIKSKVTYQIEARKDAAK